MSNDLLETLRASRETPHVAYTEFVLAVSNDTNSVYCFFEGDEDKRYYGVRIKFLYKYDFESFTCGGKDNVKKVIALIKQHDEYRTIKTLFFMDKDYSKETLCGDVYITPCYAIENFYTTTSVLKEILFNELNLKEKDDDFKKIVILFEELQNSYHSQLLLFNAWLACQNDLREETQSKTYLSIDDTVKIYFKSIIRSNLTLKDFNELNDIHHIENVLFLNTPKVPSDILEEKIAYFTELDNSCVFRGKFEIKFFISFFKNLINEIGKKNSLIFEKKRKCTLQFQEENILSILTQYANTSECLQYFLNKNLNQVVEVN